VADARSICLSIESLTKRFGGFFALNDVNTEVATGHIHALIGPNGAGKTTFFNLIAGVLAADSGSIVFEGKPLDDARPSKRTIKGVARTFQNIRLFPHLTVLETVMVGEHCRSYPSMMGALMPVLLQRPFGEAAEERRMRESAMALLDFMGIADKHAAKSSDLA
jgi:branched-chain amino acid transport system ATP-binding protein